ncbi:hypothetical protein RhiirA1_468212 [Rhizophagus irregularis]|uniref:Uncharacterized protein n=1 Tax=Rhizophagus irregularis TaxID=588596 RepID=A0A2I1F9E8_9GLOM|nr:hypothetical protein RhiirA1_468212 [Rhizophagus irregularis]PKY31001.1 hypothetical protein RhiirB3_448377 [Rhizophagus irregularis]
MVAVNEPFITTQGDHVAETNYMTNEVIKKAVDDEDFVFIILPINGLLKRTDSTTSVDDLDSTEDILPPEYKRYKGRVSHGRIKSSIEESKTLRRCKNCHGIGHYAKTCTAG